MVRTDSVARSLMVIGGIISLVCFVAVAPNLRMPGAEGRRPLQTDNEVDDIANRTLSVMAKVYRVGLLAGFGLVGLGAFLLLVSR